jgi:hypothetical protein
MRRSSILGGIVLILVGVFFLLLPYFPNLSGVIDISLHWPLIIVGVGLLFLFAALLGAPGLAIPGSIVTGIGGMLYYQNAYEAWSSWAYSWTLIPGFVAIGIIIARTIEGRFSAGLRSGGTLLIISLLMFLAFGTFLSRGISFGVLWAILFIALGLRLLLKSVFGIARKTPEQEKPADQPE